MLKEFRTKPAARRFGRPATSMAPVRLLASRSRLSPIDTWKLNLHVTRPREHMTDRKGTGPHTPASLWVSLTSDPPQQVNPGKPWVHLTGEKPVFPLNPDSPRPFTSSQVGSLTESEVTENARPSTNTAFGHPPFLPGSSTFPTHSNSLIRLLKCPKPFISTRASRSRLNTIEYPVSNRS
jgi:hypothetical protein